MSSSKGLGAERRVFTSLFPFPHCCRGQHDPHLPGDRHDDLLQGLASWQGNSRDEKQNGRQREDKISPQRCPHLTCEAFLTSKVTEGVTNAHITAPKPTSTLKENLPAELSSVRAPLLQRGSVTERCRPETEHIHASNHACSWALTRSLYECLQVPLRKVVFPNYNTTQTTSYVTRMAVELA